jgi:hypothetical protein
MVRIALAEAFGARRTPKIAAAEAAFAPPRIVFRRRYADVVELKRRFGDDPGEASRAIRIAAADGIPAAQTVWGQLLLDGELVARDPVAAFRAFSIAADRGDLEALNMLGRCHEHGWGVPADQDRAADCFRRAAARGHVWAKVNLAQILMRRGRIEDRMRCYELFRSAVAAGNLKAKNSLARFLEEGWIGERDPAGAARLYREAAEEGDHWAQFNLATILLSQNAHAEALEWLTRAVAVSDNGFRRRVAPMLLAQSRPAIHNLGLDALARCAAAGDPRDIEAYRAALAARSSDGLHLHMGARSNPAQTAGASMTSTLERGASFDQRSTLSGTWERDDT